MFSHIPEIVAPVLFPKRWEFIRTGLKINIERAQTYARIYPQAVQSQHFLIRLLMSLGVPMSLATNRYYDTVDTRSKGLSMHMKMTSPYYRGTVHEGVFYGEGSTEVLLLDEDYFDFQWVHNNWEKAVPIKVLLHPKSDLNMLMPMGKAYSEEKGLAVISINIAMLAVMYRAFTLQQTRVKDSRSPYQFLGSYVIPNMLDSHVDWAIFNRIYRQAFGLEKPSAPIRRTPFFMPSYESYVDDAVRYTVEILSEQHLNLYATMHGMPAVSVFDMAGVFQTPDVYPTVQNAWALFAARSRVLRLLIKLCEKTVAATDRNRLNLVRIAYNRNNVQAMLTQMLPFDEHFEVSRDMRWVDHAIDGLKLD